MAVNELAEELLKIVLDADPLSASLYGFPGYDDLVNDFSVQAEKAIEDRLSAIADRADVISTDGLDEGDRQTLDFLRIIARGLADSAAVPMVEFVICDSFVDPVGGFVTFLNKVPLDTEERRASYLERIVKLPAMLTTASERRVAGTKAGRTAVARLVRSAIAQMDLLIADETVAGTTRPDQEGEAAFVNELRERVDDVLRPALITHRDILEAEVLPAARDDEHAGLCHLPDGADMYARLIRRHTSIDFDPKQLHDLGREIVARVHEEFIEVGQRQWGTSELSAIFDHMCTDQSLRYSSREEMLDHARQAVATAEAEAPRWFSVIPDDPCVVEAIAPAEEAGSAAAYYMTGAVDGSRKGTYFLNTSKPEERFRYAAENIAFHEAVPGHHFQLTIALEAKDLPMVRRVLGDTACAEGWGLYSERLADEMGLYSDDLSRLGLFAADAWRASRLVVDTGIHAFGWTRSQVVEYLSMNTPMPPIEIEAETDRYIAYPGQALAYMVGRREIVRLRELSADRLTDHFDLREFHDVLLRAGSLPLPALAGVIERWVERSTV